MSEAAFLTVPYVPAEGPDPKASAVSIANASSPTWTTVDGHWE